MKRVAIPLRLAGATHGNLNYLVNLACVLATKAAHWHPVVLTETSALPERTHAVLVQAGVEIIDAPDLAHRQTALGFLQACVSRDPILERIIERAGAECIFENAAFFARQPQIPVLHWLPDLQHRELPHMFPTFARWRRELLVRSVLLSGRQILLSSNAARNSLLQYYRADADNLHVAPFASILGELAPDERVDPAQSHVFGQRPLAFVPNQFWRHKNHLVLPHAARHLADNGTPVTFVCTGARVDPRNDSYASEFDNAIRKTGTADFFVLPGLISYTEVNTLHRTCDLLVNPSLVEGWNTGVEEAKAAGSRIVVSDIPTHKEQVEHYGNAALFPPTNAVALANAIASFLQMGPPSAAERARHSAMYPEAIEKYVQAVEAALKGCSEG